MVINRNPVRFLQIILGAEIEANVIAKESVTTIGYCFDMRQNTVRGQVCGAGFRSCCLSLLGRSGALAIIYNLHLAEFSFLFFLVAQINSKGVVAGVLDNKLAPGLSFILTGQLDHMSGKSTFGMGFLIGQ